MEEDNVVRRLDSGQDNEAGNDRVYSLQGPTGENESVSPEDEGKGKDTPVHALRWFIWAAACGYLAILFYQLYQDELVRMQMLHSGIRVMRAIARSAGSCALEWEASYNDYISTLH